MDTIGATHTRKLNNAIIRSHFGSSYSSAYVHTCIHLDRLRATMAASRIALKAGASKRRPLIKIGHTKATAKGKDADTKAPKSILRKGLDGHEDKDKPAMKRPSAASEETPADTADSKKKEGSLRIQTASMASMWGGWVAS